jgi:hypothetical protein
MRKIEERWKSGCDAIYRPASTETTSGLNTVYGNYNTGGDCRQAFGREMYEESVQKEAPQFLLVNILSMQDERTDLALF